MSKKIDLEIKNKIKVFRAEHDLTQEGLADAIGVTRVTINAIEKGKYTPSLELAFKISQFFKTELTKVFYIQNVTKGENDEK